MKKERKFEFSLKTIIPFFFFFLIAIYALFQFRFIILGPHIEIEAPKDGELVTSPVVMVSGTAENISFISMNDRPIYIDEEGRWSEKLIASKGLSIITVRARDRFGRETEKKIRIVLN